MRRSDNGLAESSCQDEGSKSHDDEKRQKQEIFVTADAQHKDAQSEAYQVRYEKSPPPHIDGAQGVGNEGITQVGFRLVRKLEVSDEGGEAVKKGSDAIVVAGVDHDGCGRNLLVFEYFQAFFLTCETKTVKGRAGAGDGKGDLENER